MLADAVLFFKFSLCVCVCACVRACVCVCGGWSSVGLFLLVSVCGVCLGVGRFEFYIMSSEYNV